MNLDTVSWGLIFCKIMDFSFISDISWTIVLIPLVLSCIAWEVKSYDRKKNKTN